MTAKDILRSTNVFLLDLDGTVYLDDTPIGGAAEVLHVLRQMGKQLVFLTNNSSKTQKEYHEKLSRIGLWREQDLIYTSGMATIDYLRLHAPDARVFLLGTDALKEEFARGGITLDERAPDLCILAYDTTVTFDKLRRFDAFLKAGVRFWATHPDDVCPTAGYSMPDVGSFLALFERSAHRSPECIIGKPCAPMAECLSHNLHMPRGAMCMVGDRMHTDIRFANNNGMKSILVLSGETTEESMKNFPDLPDLVLPALDRLV